MDYQSLSKYNAKKQNYHQTNLGNSIKPCHWFIAMRYFISTYHHISNCLITLKWSRWLHFQRIITFIMLDISVLESVGLNSMSRIKVIFVNIAGFRVKLQDVVFSSKYYFGSLTAAILLLLSFSRCNYLWWNNQFYNMTWADVDRYYAVLYFH